MTFIVVLSVGIGILGGHIFLPESFMDISDKILTVGLSILLFFVGIDIGKDGRAIAHLKKVGFRILIFPFAIMAGTFAGASAASVFLPMDVLESLTVGAGFGWYSLAPILIAEKSAELSAISFMHNVLRELFGILTIPLIAKYIGYIETTALPGAAAMDVCLPVVEKSTDAEIAVYSFISGLVLSTAVPLIVPVFVQML